MSAIVDYPLGWRASVEADRVRYGVLTGQAHNSVLAIDARWCGRSWAGEVARLELARREALER
jgi:hypothetical protein